MASSRAGRRQRDGTPSSPFEQWGRQSAGRLLLARPTAPIVRPVEGRDKIVGRGHARRLVDRGC